MSIARGRAVLETKIQLPHRWTNTGQEALGYRSKQQDHPAAKMFSVRGTVGAQSLGYHDAPPSFASHRGARAAAVRSIPLANHNRNRSGARSSGGFEVTVTLNLLHEIDPFAPLLANLPAMITRPDSLDRKSTRLNSSHLGISYVVFCLKKNII